METNPVCGTASYSLPLMVLSVGSVFSSRPGRITSDLLETHLKCPQALQSSADWLLGSPPSPDIY